MSAVDEQLIRVRLPEHDGEWTIGRAESCDIVLADASISEVHAVIRREEGTLSIVDPGTFAGVYVNGMRIEQHVLRDGDDIFISPIQMGFEDDELAVTGRRDQGFRIDAIGISRHVGERTLVNDVTVSMLPGELVAIVGPSGCGKSSMLASLTGAIKPSTGRVLYDGEDLYENLDRLRPAIGYVAQFPAIHEQLTVAQVLGYESRLRLSGFSAQQRDASVSKVLETVNLVHRRDTQASRLSGGERKRLSIAVELLNEPRILWLDEPTSGLDPHMHRHFMQLFRRLAEMGMTVAVVTHDVHGFEICDRLVFLIPGGRVAFDGNPNDAPRTFGAADFVDCYQVAQRLGATVADQHAARRPSNLAIPQSRRAGSRVYTPMAGTIAQYAIKTHRGIRLLMSDRRALITMLLQAPILGLVLSIVVPRDALVSGSVSAKQLLIALFGMSLTVIWFGLINSVREFSKERRVWARERMSGASALAYVASKLSIQWGLALFQAVILFAVVGGARAGIPVDGVSTMPGWLELMITMALTGIAASTIGLMVSAVVSNEDRGSSLVPYLLIPQFLLSGILFELPLRVAWLSMTTLVYWSIAAMASTVDICQRSFIGGPTCVDALRTPVEHTVSALGMFWGVLAGVSVVGGAVVLLAVMLRDRARHF